MVFNEVVRRLSPKLRQLAVKYRRFCPPYDEEDLYGEMLTFLWERRENGGFDGKTESYIVQACYFHLRNFLRTVREEHVFVPFNEPVSRRAGGASGEGDDSLRFEEVIDDDELSLQEKLEGSALYETVMNNGLSRREKEVIRYLFDGYTVREIGALLHVSHAMVVKYKKNIAEKVSKKYLPLLV